MVLNLVCGYVINDLSRQHPQICISLKSSLIYSPQRTQSFSFADFATNP